MDKHRFKIGQTVSVARRANPSVPPGRYRVVRLLPSDATGHQYRLKSIADGHERVVRESELAGAG